MTTDVPENEPFELRAGLTWAWERTDLTDYPATTWTLKYWFKKTGATQANFSITAAASGNDFAVSVSAATTAAYTAGDYTWVAVVTAGTEAYEVDKGTLKLLPRYDQAANLDDRSHNRKMLEAIQAVLESRATKDQEEYTIGGRSLKRTPLKELREHEAYYQSLVTAETAGESIANGKIGTARLLARL